MTVMELEKAPDISGEQKYHIVDADTHLDPPYEMWGEYLPAHLRELAPRIEEGDDCDYVVFEGKSRPMMMINNQAGRDGKTFKMKGRISDLRDARSPGKRLKEMDIDGIAAAVMFGGGPLATLNSDLYIESFRAYNRFLWDFCGADRQRLAGVAYMPMRDLDQTIGMVREAARLGFRSVNIPAFPMAPDAIGMGVVSGDVDKAQSAALTGDPTSLKPYWHPDYDRLWAEICDHDLTVTFHLGGRVPRFTQKDYFLADLVMSKVAMAEPVAMAIYGGIFDRFPNMRWAIIESGVGWLSWMTEYMDRTWEKQRYWTDSKIANAPSFYMERNIYASFINDRTGVLNRHLKGGKNIMWSSDYPHSETTFPHSRAVIARDFEGVPHDEVQEIVGSRASRLFQVG